jgi:flagellar motor switch protein FliG
MSDVLNRRQKAAALILAIGPENARPLLERLSEEEIRLIANEVAELHDVDESERQKLFAETLSGAGRRSLDGGIERARQLLANYGGGDILLDDGGPRHFKIVSAMPAVRVAQLLRDEHPQVVAVVLADQNADFAADVLKVLPAEMRNDISYRIASIGIANPDTVSDLRALLESRSGGGELKTGLSLDGAKGLAAILNAAGRESEDEILGYVDGVNQEIAERVRALMFVFEDIGGLDDRSIQSILKSVDTGTLSYALKGVSDKTRDKILGNLSERARNALLEEMDLMGAIRRSEVEAAQQQVIAELRSLEEAGEVVLARGGGDELVS